VLAFTRWSDESIRPACEKGHSEAFFVHLRPDLSKILGLTRSRIGLAYRKLVVVFDHARFLATRWEEEDAVNLYLLSEGPFVEILYDTHANEITRLRAFTSSAPLEDYVVGVQLPRMI